MSGLALNVGGYGSAGYGPAAVPAAAQQAGSATIGQKAFGIGTSQTEGTAVAAIGTTALGLAGAAVLLYLWWSLPR